MHRPVSTLGAMLDRAASRAPDREAIVCRAERVTYGQWKARADGLGRGLLALGLGPGDHVALWMANSVEWNIANLAVAKIGAVTVPCNTRYKASQLEYVLRQSDARALIAADRVPALDHAAVLADIASAVGGAGGAVRFPELRHVVVAGEQAPPGARSWRDVERAGRETDAALLERIAVRPEDPAALLYTSGTTGAPRGCVLSHGNMAEKCRVYTELHRFTEADRYLVSVPYFHIFGAMGAIAANCLAGSTQVVMDGFDASEAMRLIETERVTIFSGVPAMFITILGHPERRHRDLRSLRTGSIGAAPVPVEIMKRILDGHHGLGMDALVVYGLTEATGGTHWTRPGDPLDKRVSTVGLPGPEVRDRIVDPATGRELPAGAEGELCVAGPTLMLGYHKDPDATAARVRDGWLHTGDMAVKDADGYVRITGRLTDTIVVGGSRTFPAEIENFYLRHPKVLDVSVVGVPDPIMGEVVMAFVIPRAGHCLAPEEIIDFARGTLPEFKVPRYVEVVDRFPLTGPGKVQKFKQRAYAVGKYHLE